MWIGGIGPHLCKPGRVAQPVKCLVTDSCLTADPGVGTLIPAKSRIFLEIYHEIISAVILFIQRGLLLVTSKCMYTNY